jgi:hypothetical protein
VTVFVEAVAEAKRASQWAVARVVLRELAYCQRQLEMLISDN